MRAVFLDFNIGNLNPTRGLVPHTLSAALEIEPLGPGYSDSEALERGVLAYVRRSGPYDAVVASEHILFAPPTSGTALERQYRRNYHVLFPIEQVHQGARLRDEMLQLDLIRIASTLESDYYNFRVEQTEFLREQFHAVLGWNS